MDTVEMHRSKATSSRWKGFIIKSYDKQRSNHMEPWAVWATSIREQNDPLWSYCSVEHSVCGTTNSKAPGATVLPGGACSPASHWLFLPISGAQQRLLHTASHTYAKYCWTPRSREQNGVKTDGGKQQDTLYVRYVTTHSTGLHKMKAATESHGVREEGSRCTSENPRDLHAI